MTRLALVLASALILTLPHAAHGEEEPRSDEAAAARHDDDEIIDRTEALPPESGWLPVVDFGGGTPTLSLRGFGHAQFDVAFSDPDNGSSDTTNQFAVGALDLYITSRISEDFSFLNETVFEFEEGGENILDVERLQLKYAPTDWFEVSVGRGHTPLGYWNQTFHHGVWIQTTTGRPLVYAFEDDGGILPMHFVGLEFTGKLRTDAGSFSYDAAVSNGRGRTVDELQLIEDRNDAKAFALMLRIEPHVMPGLAIGISGYHDVIPPDARAPGRSRGLPETIAGVHLLYLGDPLELLIEGLAIWHRDRSANETLRSHGGYAQLAYACGELKPYYRFDWLEINGSDPFFSDLDGVEDQTQHTVGIRWDIRTFVALKTEFRHKDADSGNTEEASVQVSFAF